MGFFVCMMSRTPSSTDIDFDDISNFGSEAGDSNEEKEEKEKEASLSVHPALNSWSLSLGC